MEQELDRLIAVIKEHYPIDSDSHPALGKGASEEEKLHFAVKHIVLHFAKTTGKASAVVEGSDHGEPLDMEALKVEVTKMLITTLRLASLTGLTAGEIIHDIGEKYNTTIE